MSELEKDIDYTVLDDDDYNNDRIVFIYKLFKCTIEHELIEYNNIHDTSYTLTDELWLKIRDKFRINYDKIVYDNLVEILEKHDEKQTDFK